jgi:REP element-mobilizing transposase RayT
VRHTFGLQVYGYVVMPEHVHLLLSEPQRDTLADALKSLKQGVSRRLISDPLKPKSGNGALIPLKPKAGLNGAPNPLKPKAGLNGPHNPLKPKAGLNGPHNPLKPKAGLNGPPVPLEHFWQKRYYDFNIRNYAQFVEKLRYIHRNPVKAGLCERPEDWQWSSFRHYATGAEGRVEIESEWTARKREREAGTLCTAVELPHSSQKQA